LDIQCCAMTFLLMQSIALYILGNESSVSEDSSQYLSRIIIAPQKSQAEQEENRFSFKHSTSVSSLAEQLVVWMTNVGKVVLVTFYMSLRCW